MQKQLKIFPGSENPKTYRAIRHDVTRAKQAANTETTHHPMAKKKQAEKILSKYTACKILELFAGQGNMTRIYEQFGTVESYDRRYLKTGDSFVVFHKLIAARKKYDVIDLDPYGFPTRMMPDIFLLIDKGFIFITMPKPAVNILNGITQTHLTAYFGEQNPGFETITNRFVLWGLCHWRKITLINYFELKSIYRFAFEVEKVKATDYTGVKNQ